MKNSYDKSRGTTGETDTEGVANRSVSTSEPGTRSSRASEKLKALQKATRRHTSSQSRELNSES